MDHCGRRLLERAPAFILTAACVALLAACSSQPTQKTSKQRTTEYFAESVWGVKASPRVSTQASNLPRGGGRDHLGRPYQIRGQWYHPKEQPDYREVGMASWYGSAFHGRLTANGEVYDMTHLTAAHPTMPLPSYARVTNLDNGTSLVVRVNDRGPFVRGRIIDLSRQSAELLQTRGNGVAKVQVEYLGRAPLHGQDEEFLLASYRPGGREPDPSDGLPDGVMLAMNGSSPTSQSTPAPRPGAAIGISGSAMPASFSSTASNPVMPETGPVIPRRPRAEVTAATSPASAGTPLLAYADSRVNAAGAALETFASSTSLSSNAIVEAWQRGNARRDESGIHIAAGTFVDHSQAEAIAAALSDAGKVEIFTVNGGMVAVVVHPDGRADIDTILRSAWEAGATDALTVRH